MFYNMTSEEARIPNNNISQLECYGKGMFSSSMVI